MLLFIYFLFVSEEDRKWFMEAMQSQTIDIIKRMKEITLVMQIPEQVLESEGVAAVDIEDMLDELQEHVESIDMANGRFATLVSFIFLFLLSLQCWMVKWKMKVSSLSFFLFFFS
uniref:Nucleotide exchange factor Fes1 domain-containing protein n=1 Tax=Nelumbo nucifera TaxID=4432 RepID=A0A822Y6W5_NELNU|nr:TPA_asm: hypothetical protein HUJ06_029718 [Nelumbo nucifera]